MALAAVRVAAGEVCRRRGLGPSDVWWVPGTDVRAGAPRIWITSGSQARCGHRRTDSSVSVSAEAEASSYLFQTHRCMCAAPAGQACRSRSEAGAAQRLARHTDARAFRAMEGSGPGYAEYRE